MIRKVRKKYEKLDYKNPDNCMGKVATNVGYLCPIVCLGSWALTSLSIIKEISTGIKLLIFAVLFITGRLVFKYDELKSRND